MSAHVTIGEFSRLTYLSVKTLRHYHDVGLLTPARIDEHSGYRHYSVDQVEDAHLIRRLRDLEMPVPEVRLALASSTAADRDAAIRDHLARMENELDRTRSVVASLRQLLTPSAALVVGYRHVPDQAVLARHDVLAMADVEAWYDDALASLEAQVARSGATQAGPAGATYGPDFFAEGTGPVTAFLPLEAGPEVLPGGWFAIAEHLGSYEDFDRTYGALGTHVAEHDEGLAEPIREHYLISACETDDPSRYRTEICWPLATGPR